MKRLAALLIACASLPSLADEPSRFSLSGFGTVSAVRTGSDVLGFRSSVVQDTGPGRSFDTSVDSVLGVQGSAHLTSKADITLQVVSHKGPDDSFKPQVTWSFLRTQVLPELSFRAGRMRTPFFMFSDSLHVNFITPWVRPPVEVYSLNPFSSVDGVDALYRTDAGPLDIEIQSVFGKSSLGIHGGTVKLRAIRTLNVAASGHGLTLHAGYTAANLDVRWGDQPSQNLLAALAATGNGSIADELNGTGAKASFTSAGFQYDRDHWLLIGEFARRDASHFISSAQGWYLTGGYRVGSVTPYVTYARQIETAPVTTSTVPIPALQTGLDLFNASRRNAQRTEGIGVRWDVARNFALKGQFDLIRPGPDGLGIFVSPPAGYLTPSGPIHVLSLSVDVVF